MKAIREITSLLRNGNLDEKLSYLYCRPKEKIQPFRDRMIHVIEGYHNTFGKADNAETVCLLSKLSDAKNHISVKIDMEEIDVTAAESKATYDEIREWVQDNYGFHVTNLSIAQVKRKHGIIERENYNKPKSEDSRQLGCPEEKIIAIEEAMRCFQMI